MIDKEVWGTGQQQPRPAQAPRAQTQAQTAPQTGVPDQYQGWNPGNQYQITPNQWAQWGGGGDWQPGWYRKPSDPGHVVYNEQYGYQDWPTAYGGGDLTPNWDISGFAADPDRNKANIPGFPQYNAAQNQTQQNPWANLWSQYFSQQPQSYQPGVPQTPPIQPGVPQQPPGDVMPGVPQTPPGEMTGNYPTQSPVPMGTPQTPPVPMGMPQQPPGPIQPGVPQTPPVAMGIPQTPPIPMGYPDVPMGGPDPGAPGGPGPNIPMGMQNGPVAMGGPDGPANADSRNRRTKGLGTYDWRGPLDTAGDTLNQFAEGRPYQSPWQWGQASDTASQFARDGRPVDYQSWWNAQQPVLQRTSFI